MIQRVADWPERLEAYLLSAASRAFSWRRPAHHCAAFAAGWVQAATGEDVLGALADLDGARAHITALADLGGLEAAVNARLAAHAAPAFARRGDLAMARMGRRMGLVIVEGETLVGVAAIGLARLPRTAAVAAWAV